MKQFQASIEFLSPVHIGSGESLGPYEYFIRDGKFHKLNMPRFISSLSPEQRKAFIDLLDRDDQIKLRTFPKQHARKDTVDLLIPVSRSIENEYTQKINGLQNRLDINLFPQDGVRKKPYLPGSSLKGAFRTAILQMLLKKSPAQDFRNTEKSFESTILKYSSDVKKDVFRALKIPDINLDSGETEILDCQMYNPKKPTGGSFDQRMQVTFSKISRLGQTKVYPFEFLFYDDLIIKANLPEKFTMVELGNSCNEHYLKIYHWEIKKFYSHLNTPEFAPMKNLKLENNQFLIRLGRFGHVESKTMDKIRNPKVRKDKTGKSFGWGKTRTLAAGKYPMGWAIITIQEMDFTKPVIDPNWQPTGIGQSFESSPQNFSQARSHTSEPKKFIQDSKPTAYPNQNTIVNKPAANPNQNIIVNKPTEYKKESSYQNKNESKPKNYNSDSNSTYNPFEKLKMDKKIGKPGEGKKEGKNG